MFGELKHIQRMAKKKRQAEFVKWFGPLLDALRDLGYSGKPKEVTNKIAENEKLDDKTLESTLKSGIKRFENQVAWARQYLTWEGLLDSTTRGTWTLTEKGKSTYLDYDQAHTLFLKWVEIHQKARKNKTKITNLPEEEQEEVDMNAETNLLDVLQSLSPSGFENVCKELLREHGFENVIVTGRSHDGGIDGYGILEINPFVSFKVLFQCKRYKGTVSRAQIGDFRNAVMGRGDKGIMLTTGTFSKDAEREASRDGVLAIELIDGEKLVKMFEKVELGVKPKVIYEVVPQYFEKFKD